MHVQLNLEIFLQILIHGYICVFEFNLIPVSGMNILKLIITVSYTDVYTAVVKKPALFFEVPLF